jgi:hypothetical protein
VPWEETEAFSFNIHPLAGLVQIPNGRNYLIIIVVVLVFEAKSGQIQCGSILRNPSVRT